MTRDAREGGAKAALGLWAIVVLAVLAFGCAFNSGGIETPGESRAKCRVQCAKDHVNDPNALLVCVLACDGNTPQPSPRPQETSVVPEPRVSPSATQSPSPTSSPSATEVSTASATSAPVLHPPTVDFVNGGNCNADKPVPHCEFNIWLKIPSPGHFPSGFEPPVPVENQAFWHPRGMALADDHMFVVENSPAGVFEPRARDAEHPTGRWVSVMWYACSGRQWIYPGDFQINVLSGNVQVTRRGLRAGDGYNAIVSGSGTIEVCLPATAYTCVDPKDFDDPETMRGGGCASGSIPLPGAGVCKGPYVVAR
jgi:hypothetical protein